MSLRDEIPPPPVWGFIGLVVFSLVLRHLWVSKLIRNTGGVRATVVSRNPLSALLITLATVEEQAKCRLIEYFNTVVDKASPELPNIIEFTFFGRPRFLITREPEHIKTVLTAKFAHFGKGPRFHQLWEPFLGDSIFTTDGELWHNSRSLIRPMFIRDRVQDLDTFDRWAGCMISLLPADGVTVDIMDLFYRMTLDVTTDFLLGTSVNSLENPKGEFVHAFNEVQRLQMLYTLASSVARFIPKGNYRKGIRVLDRFMEPYINQALAIHPDDLEKDVKSDKAFTFLHNIARYTRDPKVIRDQVIAVLLAGRDTTASTLSWCIYQLSRYPDIYKRLRSEILSVVGPQGDPSYEDLKNMRFLTHTLNETLRLHPAVPVNVRACLEDTTLTSPHGQPDVGVLKGDLVVYSALAMHQRRDLYPPVSPTFADPDLFSPERWENWSPKPWQYLPFNGGPRICVGQNFAMTEMAYTMVRFVQKFERIEYRGDWEAQRLKAEVVGRPLNGVPVALYRGSSEKA